jgi:DNA ligase (NAD+)|tara:strand:- start:671 stop:1660 length:990 start_codon:yes stop_codon:yes gene_type:complete
MSIEKLLDEASKAYYEGEPIMHDWQFDALQDFVDYERVGYKTEDKIKHKSRLYSLQKIFEGDKAPVVNVDMIETPKLDGACVSLLYREGDLTQALTRGDGIEGVDITSKMFHSKIVPTEIEKWSYIFDEETKWIQVTGEVVAPKSIPNSRNYAAGALNLKDNKEFVSRDLTFIAHDMVTSTVRRWRKEDLTYELDMECLQVAGFKTVLDSEWEEFPHDGRVFRINRYEEYKKLGYTSHHPRGAYALKKQQETQRTILKDVVWQVGKSGQVSPVAIVDPVKIGGALVRRATLHNIAYIEDLGLEIGCEVEIIRSGEIIPRIVGVVPKNNS